MPTQLKSYWDQFESDEPQIQNTGKSYFDQFDSEPDEQIPQQKTDNRGMLRKSWDALTNPLIDIPIGDVIDKPSEFRSPTRARIEGFIGGTAQGLVDDAVSPLGIATAGAGSLMSKAGKAGIRGIGKLTEMAGQGLQKYNPILSKFLEPGAIKAGRELVGSGLEMVGNKMRGVGNGLEDLVTNENVKNLPTELPKLNTFKVIRNNESETLSPIAKEFLSKRKLRSNSDGTFTDINTGEVLNSKGESVIEINRKPISEMVKLYRGEDGRGGNWFTENIEKAKHYASLAETGKGEGKIFQIEIPKKDLPKYEKTEPNARGRKFNLPDEIIKNKQEYPITTDELLNHNYYKPLDRNSSFFKKNRQ